MRAAKTVAAIVRRIYQLIMIRSPRINGKYKYSVIESVRMGKTLTNSLVFFPTGISAKPCDRDQHEETIPSFI